MCSFPEARFGEFLDSLDNLWSASLSLKGNSPVGYAAHVFCAILIGGEMYSTKGPSSNLLLNDILIDAVDSATIVVTTAVM